MATLECLIIVQLSTPMPEELCQKRVPSCLRGVLIQQGHLLLNLSLSWGTYSGWCGYLVILSCYILSFLLQHIVESLMSSFGGHGNASVSTTTIVRISNCIFCSRLKYLVVIQVSLDYV